MIVSDFFLTFRVTTDLVREDHAIVRGLFTFSHGLALGGGKSATVHWISVWDVVEGRAACALSTAACYLFVSIQLQSIIRVGWTRWSRAAQDLCYPFGRGDGFLEVGLNTTNFRFPHPLHAVWLGELQFLLQQHDVS